MAHTLLLGFYESPSGTQDYVDLSAVSSAAGGKYFLNNISFGEIRADSQGQPVRDISITLSINGSSVDDALFRLRELDRYPQTTRQFFKPFEGNIPATVAGDWFDGRAAKLTFKPQGSTNAVFWDVLYGQVTFPGVGIINEDILGYQIENVVLTLTCMPYARGPRVMLVNLVNSGGMESPFDIASASVPTYQDGWTPDVASNWAMSTAYARYGTQSVKNAVTTGTITFTTNDIINSSVGVLWTPGSSSGDVLLPKVSYFSPATIASGGIALTITMEAWNGTAWVTKQTLVNAATSVAGGSWITATGTAVMAVNDSSWQKVRLKVSLTPGGNTLYFGGFAIFSNLTGGVAAVAPAEFVSSGGRVGMPHFCVYDVRGDVETPMVIGQTMIDSGASGTSTMRGLVVGGMANDTTRGDRPLLGMSVQTATGAADDTMFWGKLGATATGGLAIYTYTVTMLLSPAAIIDAYPRNYRAFIVYAKNNSDQTTQIRLTLNSNFTYKFFVALPPTMATVGIAPVRSDYRIYELGDIQYPLPGSNFISGGTALGSSNLISTIYATNTNSANHNEGVAGLILVPVDNVASVNSRPDKLQLSYHGKLRLSNEGAAPSAAIIYPTSPAVYTGYELNTVYSPSLSPVADFTSSVVRFGEFGLLTTDMRFEILSFLEEDTTYPGLYTFEAARGRNSYLTYSPRYRAVNST